MTCLPERLLEQYGQWGGVPGVLVYVCAASIKLLCHQCVVDVAVQAGNVMYGSTWLFIFPGKKMLFNAQKL